MAKKKKIPTHGGARPGAGRKATGANTIPVGFSVHKDHVDLIKQLVKSTLRGLKEKTITVNQVREMAQAAEIKPAPVKEPESQEQYVKRVVSSPSFQAIAKKKSSTTYLEKRRKDKLKIE